MLKTYPNLWIDLSWVVYSMDVAPSGIPTEEWVAIVEEFPDRFMLGTDKIGHYEDYGSMRTILPWTVSKDTRSGLCGHLRQTLCSPFLTVLPALHIRGLALMRFRPGY